MSGTFALADLQVKGERSSSCISQTGKFTGEPAPLAAKGASTGNPFPPAAKTWTRTVRLFFGRCIITLPLEEQLILASTKPGAAHLKRLPERRVDRAKLDRLLTDCF